MLVATFESIVINLLVLPGSENTIAGVLPVCIDAVFVK